MPKVLIISHNEICYNARLLKAADVYQKVGWEVDVFNAITGIAPAEVYREIIQSRKWNVIENDISRRSMTSKIRWLFNGILFKLVRFSVDVIKLKIWDKYYLSKALLLSPKLSSKKYELIIIHLIDHLPFAVKLKKRLGATLIYDSQEYFVGQYAEFDKKEFEWVKRNEEKYIYDVDILLSTTNVMLKKIMDRYQLSLPAFRVRNVPSLRSKIESNFPKSNNSTEPLKLIWHGMAIYFNNRRGVDVLLKAVALCKEKVKLYLQGNFPDDQQRVFNQYKEELKLEGKVMVLPSAKPDRIVESIIDYDVGLTGELPIEENQQLTSSNKLFDYIHAGLAVISSDALGLAETIDEYKVGLKYEPGNFKELSEKIDYLARNAKKLEEYKLNSMQAAKKMYWEEDYAAVLSLVNKIAT